MVASLGLDILAACGQGCSETSCTLLLGANGDGKPAMPYFSERADFTSAVLTDDLVSGRHSGSPDTSALPRLHLRGSAARLVRSQTRATPLRGPGPGRPSGVSPACSTVAGDTFLRAESRTKPRGRRRREWGIPGCHSLSRHIRTDVQRGLKDF